MFEYDKNTICKFLATSELEFYQNIPESLKRFAPQFRGIVSVQYYEDESGDIRLIARPQILTIDSNDENDSSFNVETMTTENTLLKSIQ